MHRSACAWLLLLCSIAGACGESGSNLCEVNADCDSNFCKADGTCGPAQTDDADADVPDGSSELCTPNADGNITLNELPLVAGKMANFRVALDASFDTTGTAQGNGARVWDLSGTLSNDADAALSLLSPTGQYWAADFPTATYATRVSADPANDLLGVYHLDDDKLTLLGIVSPTAGTGSTNVSYDPPVTILDLPITAGATWMSTGNVVGDYQGSYVNYDETYKSSVDKAGTMKTPYGDFPVLRVSTLLDQTGIVFPYTSFGKRRSFAWLAECFGSVANVTSQNFDDAAEFNDAAEVRRLVP